MHPQAIPRHVKQAYIGAIVFLVAGFSTYLLATLYQSTIWLNRTLDKTLFFVGGQFNSITISEITGISATPSRAVLLYIATTFPFLTLWFLFTSLSQKRNRDLFINHLQTKAYQSASTRCFYLKIIISVLVSITAALACTVFFLYSSHSPDSTPRYIGVYYSSRPLPILFTLLTFCVLSVVLYTSIATTFAAITIKLKNKGI